MIEQVLAMRHVAGGRIGSIGEQDETVSIREMGADRNERFKAHMFSRAAVAVGEQAERIGV